MIWLRSVHVSQGSQKNFLETSDTYHEQALTHEYARSRGEEEVHKHIPIRETVHACTPIQE